MRGVRVGLCWLVRACFSMTFTGCWFLMAVQGCWRTPKSCPTNSNARLLQEGTLNLKLSHCLWGMSAFWKRSFLYYERYHKSINITYDTCRLVDHIDHCPIGVRAFSTRYIFRLGIFWSETFRPEVIVYAIHVWICWNMRTVRSCVFVVYTLNFHKSLYTFVLECRDISDE